MIPKGLLIVAVIALIYPISGTYIFKEDIHTYGVGLMSARTNLPYAQDKAQGNGIQSYSRDFNTNGQIYEFNSSYNLSKCPVLASASMPRSYADFEKNSLRNNQYMLSTSPSGGSQHIISIIGNPLDMDPSMGEMYINASGQITRSNVYTDSNYKINANADFHEKLIEDGSEYTLNKHPVVLAESWVLGTFSANSSFNADLPFTNPIDSLKIWAGIGVAEKKEPSTQYYNNNPAVIIFGATNGTSPSNSSKPSNQTHVISNCSKPNCTTPACWDGWYKACLNSTIPKTPTPPANGPCNSPECWQNWYRDHMN